MQSGQALAAAAKFAAPKPRTCASRVALIKLGIDL